MARVLITGCSSGIGLETALTFARSGHKVYATMRNLDRATTLRQRMEAEKLPGSILQMDVDSDESVATTIAQVQSREGTLDVLVNNAGIERLGSIEETPWKDLRAAMETNYFGALRCIRACMPEMRKRRSGWIVNVSSVAGKISPSPLSPYSASKYALEAISEALAQEGKPFNIRVAIVEPGIIATPMAERISDPLKTSAYPQVNRFHRMFEASLENPTPPTVVADKILEIFQTESWQLRHVVGPSAQPFLDWRNSMTDEQWVEWGSLDDDAWHERVRADFGLDVRPKPEKKAVAS
jgi:NAD(P)-dependent dehydrogenase (short-subunit alcohol dehydrogenase family)